ncbi:MAG: peptidylprolyl isomerase [Deltaproteobacteria bacterium]|nr:peptidylprolyl isomerase [Deltaproteobacteria bacterium]
MTDSNGLSKSTVVMKTSKGTIKFKFYSKDAPNTVARFVELVQSKFYNGLAFHRVVPGFVVQTGDPKSRNKSDPTIGTGGSGTKLKAEFSSRKHVRGSVAMARATDPDSADSQFYVCYGSFPHLDGKYTVIGQVVDFGEKIGEKDVLDRIMQWDEVTGMTIE